MTSPAANHSGGFDPATGMPRIDRAKLSVVAPNHRYADERMKPVAIDPKTGKPPNALRADRHPNDIGAFREACAFAGMNFDDPIVFPREPGRSHLHTYFGSFADARTTTENIRKLPWSSCAGGTLNMTAYWVPSMIDTRTGTPQVPTSNNAYYKCSYEFPTPAQGCANIVPVPVGLRLIAGNAQNRDPAGAKATNYICYGPHGENPGWKRTITAAYADGTCVPGGDFVMEVHFPNCWDGVNLDSADHQAHVVNVVQDQSPPFHKRCPATHPKQLPTITYNIHYAIPDAEAVSHWRLASDMYDPKLPAGLSGHGDYMMGWKPEVVDIWTEHCLHEQRDCHNYLLGDNRNMLY